MGQAKNRGSLEQRVAQAQDRIAAERQEQRMADYRRKAAREAEMQAVLAAKREHKPRPPTPMMDREAARVKARLLVAAMMAVVPPPR